MRPDGVGAVGEAANMIDRQRRHAELGMRWGEEKPARNSLHDLHRAGNRVAAAGGSAAVAWAAVHRDGHVHPAAVTEADPVAGAVEQRHLGAHAGFLEQAADGIMAAGLAGDAAKEDKFAEHDLAGQAIGRAVADFAAVGIGHRRGRLIHRVGH